MYHGGAGPRDENTPYFRPNLVSADETRKRGCVAARTAGRIIRTQGSGTEAAAGGAGVRPLTSVRVPEAEVDLQNAVALSLIHGISRTHAAAVFKVLEPAPGEAR